MVDAHDFTQHVIEYRRYEFDRYHLARYDADTRARMFEREHNEWLEDQVERAANPEYY